MKKDKYIVSTTQQQQEHYAKLCIATLARPIFASLIAPTITAFYHGDVEAVGGKQHRERWADLGIGPKL